jgi:hypothetical protein
MSQLANVIVNFLVYSDTQPSNKPLLRDIDYQRRLVNIATDSPFSQKVTLQPQSTLTIASTLRSTSQASTTQFAVTNTVDKTFRFRYTGTGTNPVLRTKRTIGSDSTTVFTVTKTGNVVRFTFTGTGTAPSFVSNSVAVGDYLNVESGGPFNVSNEGYFQVVTVTATYIEVINSGGAAEANIALGANINSVSPFTIFSAAGVQIGDSVKITSTNFNIENRGVFSVSAVTADYFELDNGNPGIPETTTIGSSGDIVFYRDIYSWLYLESDQRVSVRLNGDSTNNVEVVPLAAGDSDQPGILLIKSEIYTLTIANLNDVPVTVKVALTE